MTEPIEGRTWAQWADFVAASSGIPISRWLWIDLDGVHLAGGLPRDAPISTHLWGWGADSWIRVRCEPASIVAAILRRTDDVVRSPSQAWPTDEKRVGMVGPDGGALRGARIGLIQHPSSEGLTFVEVVT